MEEYTNLETPEDAKKYIFAEDFISCFMFEYGFRPNFPERVTKWDRNSIPRAFSDIVRTAANFLYCRISVFNTFRSFKTSKMMSLGTFLLFAQSLEGRYFMNGYNPQKFLYFCSHLAYITIQFLRMNDKTSIPKISVNCIMKTMKVYEISEPKFWNGLSIAAFMYLKIAVECGFTQVSHLDFLRIQFVVKKPLKDKNFKHNDGAIADGLGFVGENNIGKLAARNKPSKIDKNDSLFTIQDDKITAENEKPPTLHKEKTNESPNTGGPTEIEIKPPKLGAGDKSYSGKDCAGKRYTTRRAKSKKKLSPKRERRVSKLINTLINRRDMTVSYKNNNLIDPRQVQQNVECSMTDAVVDRKSVEVKFEEAAESDKKADCLINLNESSSAKNNPDKNVSNCTSVDNSNKEHDIEGNSKPKDSQITVDFRASDEYVIFMIQNVDEENLFGQSSEEFLSTEDSFNSTFDILTTLHYMASNHGIQVLDLEKID